MRVVKATEEESCFPQFFQGSGNGWNGNLSILEQDSKPFLREMLIMRQYFADAFGLHRPHRNAVGEAVFLIPAGFVKVYAGKECVAGLWMNRDGRVVLKIADKINRLQPDHRPCLGKRVQNFGQNLLGRNQVASRKGTAGFLGGLVPLILGVVDGDPIERIDEDSPHAGGRFGVP